MSGNLHHRRRRHQLLHRDGQAVNKLLVPVIYGRISYDFLRTRSEIVRKNPAFRGTRPSLRDDLVEYGY